MFSPNFVRAQDVSDLKNQRQDIQKQIDDLNQLIEDKKNDAVNLENQINIFDAKIEQLELQIQETQLEIDEVTEAIDILTTEIGRQQRMLDYQKEILDESIQILYERGDQSLLMILLSAQNFSDFIDQVTYLEAVKDQVRNTIAEINRLKSNLEKQRGELNSRKNELEDLKQRKDEEQGALENQRSAKELLLEQTQGEEQVYQQQLNDAIAEEDRIGSEIDRLLEEAKQKLYDQYPDLVGGDGFGYPLAGYNRIGVIGGDFMDPYYGFGMPHYGVDLYAQQGTPVYAAASGIVVVAHDSGGPGLSYIAIQHGNGYLTKYLHMSEIFVSSGEYVSRGEVIGLSGGAPGSRGAGYFTTGPHLHFEVRDANGNAFNPNNILDFGKPY